MTTFSPPPDGTEREKLPEAPGFPRLNVPYRPWNDNPQLHFEGLVARLQAGLRNMHFDVQRHAQIEFESAVIVQCLIQALMNKGVVSRPELDALLPQMSAGVEKVRQMQITGPRMTVPPPDSSEPKDLDCSAHHATCDAACCTSFNVFLTEEEASSNKYLWDLAMPYRLLVDDSGRCVYFDADNLKCSIWRDRPVSCRNFDCRSDGRIWDDYPKRTLSLMMMESKARQAALRQKARADAEAATAPPEP